MRTFTGRLVASALIVAMVVLIVALAAGASPPASVAAAAAALGVGVISAMATGRGLSRRAEAVADPAGGGERRDELAPADESIRTSLEGVEAAREKGATYARILGAMREGVLLADADGRIAFSNQAFERLHESVPDGLAGLSPAALREAALDCARNATPAMLEVEVGSPAKWLRASAAPVGDDGSVLVVLRDITEARRLDRVRRDFVTNASHELKTPAASIQAAAETIRHASIEDPSVVPRFAEQLDREALRLSRIVADLLDLSRLEAGVTSGTLVDLDRLVIDECERFSDLAERSEVILTIDAQPVQVSGSDQDLRLLVRNLADNACRYTSPGGRVKVTVSREDARGRLEVADTGIGIPARELPRVFERFYRVDRARSRETGGTGLGLSLVKHIVENHGGTITVDSELGLGTTFTVLLPGSS